MAVEGEEIHRETDEARGGSTPNIVRWILAISLFAAIVLLSAIWIFGAWSQGPEEEASTAQERVMAEDATGDTDGVLIEGADDQTGAADGTEMQDGLEVIENNADEPAQ